ncbi:MAG: lamin tail domain-containing protein [Clostridiales bacterium]|nr:lamin tail domain-containing protein [Clostridiales bacterium]
MMKKILIFLLALMLIFPISCKKEEETENITDVQNDSLSDLVISEVMSGNEYWLEAEDGSYPDWVELYNAGSSTIDLSGYSLTDDENDPEKYIFPSKKIGTGEYMIIYCTDEESNTANDGILRTGFKISSDGETISIFKEGEKCTALVVPAMPDDVSYGITQNDSYAFYALPTPGALNEGISSDSPYFEGSLIKSPIVINEYMAENLYSLTDEDGDRFPWVEIKNTGSESIEIGGYGLSDSKDNTKKWIFPEMELAPGEIKVIFLSGKDKITENGEIHASFKLGSQDSTLLISEYRGKQIDEVAIERAGSGNVSHGRNPNNTSEWLFFAEPTPGFDNTTKGFKRIDISEEKYLPDVSID